MFIHGWGAVTTLGWSAEVTARNLIAGEVQFVPLNESID
jgi:hypothetical protein